MPLWVPLTAGIPASLLAILLIQNKNPNRNNNK